jgi:hypothetical protein
MPHDGKSVFGFLAGTAFYIAVNPVRYSMQLGLLTRGYGGLNVNMTAHILMFNFIYEEILSTYYKNEPLLILICQHETTFLPHT